jgi:DNA-binding MarR family transcriptional regulator
MSEPFLPMLPCLCGSLRRAARSLTQLYEDALRPFGMRSTQHTILQALSRTGEVSQRKLGEILAMDSTSLTRTLAIMRRRGWIQERPGKDRRERLLRLANAGQQQLERVLPAWEKVQSRMRHQLGEEVWNRLFELTHGVTRLVATQGGK